MTVYHTLEFGNKVPQIGIVEERFHDFCSKHASEVWAEHNWDWVMRCGSFCTVMCIFLVTYKRKSVVIFPIIATINPASGYSVTQPNNVFRPGGGGT